MMKDLIKREDAINAIQCVTDSPNFSKALGKLLRIPSAEQTENSSDCLTCRYNSDEWDSPKCDGCSKAHSNYEPQTDCAWK